MQITEIAYHGIKGARAPQTIKIAPLTFIAGRNRGGKSTVRDALLLALSGAHLDLPKTNAGVMTLASGSVLEAKATFDDGAYITKRWSIGKGGKIGCENLGTAPSFELTQFAPSEFIGLGPKARLAYLAARADRVQIRAVLAAQLSGHEDLLDVLDEADDALVALTAIEEKIVDRRRAAKQELDRLTKASRDHAANAPVCTEEEVDIASRKEKDAADLAFATAQIRTLRESLNAAIERAEQIERWERNNASLPRPLGPEEITELADLQRAAEAYTKIAAERARIEYVLRDLRNDFVDDEERAGLIETIGDATDRVIVTPVDNGILEEIRTLENDIERNNDRIRLLKREVDDINRTELPATCSHCGQAIDQSTALAARERRLEEIETEGNTLTEYSRGAAVSIGSLKAQVATAESLFRQAEQINAALDRLDEDRAAREAYAEELAALNALPAPLTTSQVERLTTLGQRDRDARAPREARPEPLGNPDEIRDAIEGARVIEQTARERAEQSGRAANAVASFNAWTETKDRIERELADAAAAVEKVKTAEDRLEKAKRETVAEVWRPVLDIATKVLQATFDDAGMKADFSDTTVGISDAAGYRPFEVLSGSEQTALAFALSVSAASRETLRLVMIDELGALDEDARGRFVDHVAYLVHNRVIDQAILIHHTPPAVIHADWLIVKPD